MPVQDQVFKAILFDLDGTLLQIDMNQFLQHYFRLMADMAVQAGYQKHRQLVENVFKSTGVMIDNRDPHITNEVVFMTDFLGSSPYPQADFAPFFAHFYREGFPRLAHLCKPHKGVPELIKGLAGGEIKIALATNAVFPLTALQQRIIWAGLNPEAFDLITSYEVMHFCKPHLEYYQEICSKLQVNPEDCLMVGNDVGEDMIAQKLGMKTFLVEDQLIDLGDTSLKPTWRGKMDDFLSFAKRRFR